MLLRKVIVVRPTPLNDQHVGKSSHSTTSDTIRVGPQVIPERQRMSAQSPNHIKPNNEENCH